MTIKLDGREVEIMGGMVNQGIACYMNTKGKIKDVFMHRLTADNGLVEVVEAVKLANGTDTESQVARIELMLPIPQDKGRDK